MKILFVRSGNNGTDPITQNQGESLRKADCEVEFFNIVGKGIVGYLRNLFILSDVIKKTNPEIIHAHYVYSGILTSFSFSGKPVITSLMGSDVNNAGLFTLWLIRFFTRFVWGASIVKAKCMYDKLGCRNLFIVPNGVDLEVFKPIDKVYAQNKLSWSSRCYNILFPADPGRKEKNFELCQKAIDILKLKFPEVQLHFLVGITPSEVSLWYNAADVVILTSLSEGSPNVIKEAMACNCPIVSTDVGDVKEIIAHTEGCFITGFDPEEICEKTKLALKFGRRTLGRERIKNVSEEVIAKKILNVYSEVMGASQ